MVPPTSTASLVDPEAFARSHRERRAVSCGVTLVAFHGDDKPAGMDALIGTARARLSWEQSLWITFSSRRAIHGTIIGMEAARDPQGEMVHNGLAVRRTAYDADTPIGEQAIDFGGLTAYLKAFDWPIRIRFGGACPEDENPFDATRPPYERAFSVHPTGLVVAIGWPVGPAGDLFDPVLGRLRRDLEQFHIVHKYHPCPGAFDNDFFVVLGSVNHARWVAADGDARGAAMGGIADYVEAMRTSLCERPLSVDIVPKQVSAVRYARVGLEVVERRVALPDMSPDHLRALYT